MVSGAFADKAECQNTSKLSREIVTRWYHNARRRMGR